jgi:hypothetical protein
MIISRQAAPCLAALLLGGILFAATASTSFAGLEFKTRQVQHKAAFAESAFEATFEFVVTGDQPVTIRNLRSTCGCTVPSLSQETYAPGETDAVRAIFTYGSRTGSQHKTIFVETSEGTIELRLTVEIPVKWEANTRSLFWSQGEPRTAKELTVKFHYDLPVELTEIAHLQDAFELISTETDPDGSAINFEIAPKGTFATGIHRAEIAVRTAGGEEIKIPLYLRAL